MAQEGRMTRRLLGLLSARLPELQLERVADPREVRGRRWKLSSLLTAAVVGLVGGCRSLADVEVLTGELSRATRRRLGLGRRTPDTTLRDVLVRLSVESLRQVLHRQVRAARRRRALKPEGLPFGVAALDGKSTWFRVWDNLYAQRQRTEDGKGAFGLLRSVSACLVSAASRPCLDAQSLPAGTSEVGHYRAVLGELLRVYGKGLFRLVSYDAGGCSEENADFTVAQGLHYLFAVKENQPGILEKLRFFLGGHSAERATATSEDVLSDKSVVTRRVFLVERQPLYRWSHARTFLRIDSEKRDKHGQLVHHETRYFLSSLPRAEMTDAQWLLVVRRHWGVENNVHGVLDVAFQEDAQPWIEASPQGAFAVLLLRRVALNLLGFFRCVTQRSDERRATPWRALLRGIYLALVTATEDSSASLRPRVAAAS
jgi:predicted transposase YbfD/YdcC